MVWPLGVVVRSLGVVQGVEEREESEEIEDTLSGEGPPIERQRLALAGIHRASADAQVVLECRCMRTHERATDATMRCGNHTTERQREMARERESHICNDEVW